MNTVCGATAKQEFDSINIVTTIYRCIFSHFVKYLLSNLDKS